MTKFEVDVEARTTDLRVSRHAEGLLELAPRERLDTERPARAIQPLAEALDRRVIGQERAIAALVGSSSRLLSGLRDPRRPLMTALLLGPTGVGKTETAKAVAEACFGDETALTRINCEEYAHGHEIAKLLGSPPGYVGHQTEPLLSQGLIDAPHRRLKKAGEDGPAAEAPLAERIVAGDPDACVSVLLFDEIEKADPALWNALLGVLEDGTLTLGNNQTTDLTGSIILLTSNVGSAELGRFLERAPVGFGRDDRSTAETDDAVVELTLKAARESFPAEFLNRFDEVLVYSALEEEDLEAIFDKFLAEVHDRALKYAGVPILIRPTPAARRWIVERGTDLRLGARPLRRAVESELVDPLSRLIAAESVEPGDVVDIDVEEGRLVFFRRSHALEIVA